MCQWGIEGYEHGTLVDAIYMYMCSNTLKFTWQQEESRRVETQKTTRDKLVTKLPFFLINSILR